MRRHVLQLSLAMFAFLCPAYGQRWQGVWAARGNWEGLGAYTGQVELRWNGANYDFARVVALQDYTYSGREVHAAWTGTAEDAPGGLRIRVLLLQADFVPAVGEERRTEADASPLEVSGSFQEQGEERTLVGRYAGEDSARIRIEEELSEPSPAGETPIFAVARRMAAMHEAPAPVVREALFALYRDYHGLPAVARYSDREEFRAAVHFVVTDATNYDFYQAHPQALCVVNKIVDPIALTEESIRASAYRYTLREKAALYDTLTRENVNPVTGMVDDFDPVTGTHRASGDGALWTGTYIASQAMRYLTSAEEEAADNMAGSLAGLLTLVDITDDNREFARTVRPAQRPVEGNWRAGTGRFAHLDWLCCGNNDMLKGLQYGFLWGTLALPPRYEEIRQGIRERIQTLARFGRVANDGRFNEMATNWIAYYATHQSEFRRRYERIARDPANLAWLAAGNGASHFQGISDWSGLHLNIIGLTTFNVLAREMGDRGELFYQLGLRSGFQILRHTRPALWTLAYAGLARRVSGPPADAVEDARWRLREFPFPKPYTLALDHSIRQAWVMSPYPSLPWKLDWMTNPGRQQGLYAYPLFEHGDDSYAWKSNPLSFRHGASSFRASGADYLHAYWLARYFQVLSEAE